jgi:hypothetical protein
MGVGREEPAAAGNPEGVYVCASSAFLAGGRKGKWEGELGRNTKQICRRVCFGLLPSSSVPSLYIFFAHTVLGMALLLQR